MRQIKVSSLSAALLRAATPFLPLLKKVKYVTQYKDGSCAFETVIPLELSLAGLQQQHPNQRRKKPSGINSMTREMKEGKFVFTHDPIASGYDGTIVNGQNRMHAAVKAKAAFPALVVFNMSPKEVARLDGGTKRTIADHLSMMGDKDAATRWTKHYTECFSVLYRLTQGWSARALQDDITKTERKYKEEMLALQGLYNLYCKVGKEGKAPSVWAAVYYAMWRNPKRVHAAIKSAIEGSELKPGTPMYTLNQWFQYGNRKNGKKMVGGAAQEANILAVLRALKAELEGVPLVGWQGLSDASKAKVKGRNKPRKLLDEPAVRYFSRDRATLKQKPGLVKTMPKKPVSKKGKKRA